MKLSELKKHLEGLTELKFVLPSAQIVPQHFHVTEVGQITKHFIDCGGTERQEKVVNFQLWNSTDYDHRLGVKKLSDIIQLSETKLGIEDAEIEVEYQGETIGKYGLEFSGSHFLLTAKMTDCLAPDKCGIPETKQKIKLSDLSSNGNACCEPGGKCC